MGTPPIIRSTYNCNYSIWHWSNRLCYLPQSCSSWNAVPAVYSGILFENYWQYRIVCNVHCCTVLLKKMCKFYCNLSGVKNGERTRVIIYRCELWFQKRIWPRIPSCTYSLKGTSVISCNEHSWINIGFSADQIVTVTLRVFTCPLRWNRASSLNGMSVISQFIQHAPHEATISQNSVLLHDLHGRGWVGPQSSYMDSSATVCYILC